QHRRLERLDASEAVRTKLDVREFSPKQVPKDVVDDVMEAARLSPSGVNSQHWRFILVRGRDRLSTLAEDSSTGGWVEQADFAVVICTDPKRSFHAFDAGRAAQNMQVAAWGHGVTSGLYTGFKQSEMKKDFDIPEDMNVTAVVAFGYPAHRQLGKKSRLPMGKVAFDDRFGKPLA
ncbi:MAG TPA: nitroreductase family protein, partial [Nitrososphaerales archaeon]|nr:nitroreductase family protein [Nitrososphaerales archaeon]